MSRKIIALEESTMDIGHNKLDFSDFEPIMSGDLEGVVKDIDLTLGGLCSTRTHGDITSIISTEGFGNRPQIAHIALSAIETKLFGRSISVGTESRTRIVMESKNIFTRTWDAIVSFFKKLWLKVKSLFTSSGEKRAESKKEDIKNTSTENTIKKLQDGPKSKIPEDEIPSNLKEDSLLIVNLISSMFSKPQLFAVEDPHKRDGNLIGPADIIDSLKKLPTLLESISKTAEMVGDVLKNDITPMINEIEKLGNNKDKVTEVTNTYTVMHQTLVSELNAKITKIFNHSYVPNMLMVQKSNYDETAIVNVMRSYHYRDLLHAKKLDTNWGISELIKLLKRKDEVADLFSSVKDCYGQLNRHGEIVDSYNKIIKDLAKDRESQYGVHPLQRILISIGEVNVAYYSRNVTIANAYVGFLDSAYNLIMEAGAFNDKVK